MKNFKRFLCLFLAVALLAYLPQAAAAPDITLTAVNDQFLPLSSGTMPARKNGELYVPYSVFTGALGVHATYDDKQQLLILYNWDNTLNFSVAQGYVYDQSDKTYAQPPYTINGTTYVSVKLVCGVFGLSYSTISAEYPVLRIVNDNATLSDHTFVANASDTIKRLVSGYLGGSSASGSTTTTTPPKPTEPTIPVQPPKAEEKIPQPSLVYLMFVGAPNDTTGAILNTLATYGRTATFFLPVQGTPSSGDAVRHIVSDGHALGLSFTADASVADPAALLALLTQENDRLLRLCGVQTRLVCAENGADALSDTQRDALTAAGYRLWSSTLDAREDTRNAYRAAEAVLKAFQQSAAPAVVRFRQTDETSDALTYVLRYMRIAAIRHGSMQLSTTPLQVAR